MAVSPRYRIGPGATSALEATYQNMVTAGDLLVQDGRRVPDLSIFIEQALNRLGTPSVIVADHFRRPELADALDSSPMPRGRDVRDEADAMVVRPVKISEGLGR